MVESDPNTSFITAAQKRLASHMQQIVDHIEDCSVRQNGDTKPGDDGAPKVLSKLQARLYSKRLADIKLMIDPGMAETLEALCSKNINHAYHEKHSAIMKSRPTTPATDPATLRLRSCPSSRVTTPTTRSGRRSGTTPAKAFEKLDQ